MQAPFRLRQHGSFCFIYVSLLRSRSAKAKHKKEMKYRRESSELCYRVSSVILAVLLFSLGERKKKHYRKIEYHSAEGKCRLCRYSIRSRTSAFVGANMAKHISARMREMDYRA
jgi:hypothetical protein